MWIARARNRELVQYEPHIYSKPPPIRYQRAPGPPAFVKVGSIHYYLSLPPGIISLPGQG